MYIGLTEPDNYLDNADLAIPFYQDFIDGWFSHYNHVIIPLIAIGQLFIACGMLLMDLVGKTGLYWEYYFPS